MARAAAGTCPGGVLLVVGATLLSIAVLTRPFVPAEQAAVAQPDLWRWSHRATALGSLFLGAAAFTFMAWPQKNMADWTSRTELVLVAVFSAAYSLSATLHADVYLEMASRFPEGAPIVEDLARGMAFSNAPWIPLAVSGIIWQDMRAEEPLVAIIFSLLSFAAIATFAVGVALEQASGTEAFSAAGYALTLPRSLGIMHGVQMLQRRDAIPAPARGERRGSFA